MGANNQPYVVFQDVHVQYRRSVRGLGGVSLAVQKGEFVFFVGRTGAGKSTLLKLLTGEVKPTSGIVRLADRDLGDLRERDIPGLRRQMGIVPQDFALLPKKRVWENVAYAMRAVGHSRREVRHRVPGILEQVNIAHRADAYPDELSGGEQQRVAIARALINNPPLLLADEPTGNLDPEHSWEIMEILRSLNEKGTTILVASHDMMVIDRMGKRIVEMEEGKVVRDSANPSDDEAVGTTAHVFPVVHPAHQFVQDPESVVADSDAADNGSAPEAMEIVEAIGPVEDFEEGTTQVIDDTVGPTDIVAESLVAEQASADPVNVEDRNVVEEEVVVEEPEEPAVDVELGSDAELGESPEVPTVREAAESDSDEQAAVSEDVVQPTPRESVVTMFQHRFELDDATTEPENASDNKEDGHV